MAITIAPTHLPAAFRAPARRTRHHAQPQLVGARLLAAVERAAADPGSPAAPAELRAGLAWVAAAGETCRITQPVDFVRAALDAIARGDVAAATAALADATAELRDAPAVPTPRPAPGGDRRAH